MKIKLKKLTTIEVLDPIQIDDFKEYLLALVVSPAGTFQPPKADEKNEEPIQFMEVVVPKMFQEIGTNKTFKVEKGKTPSQKLRFVLRDLAETKGVEKEEYYQAEMSKIINHYKEKLT